MSIKPSKNGPQFLRAIKSAQDLLPPDRKSKKLFAVIGRSNVGKSTFINTITNTKNLCRTGARPGVTQQVNLFQIDKQTHLADLPGYGYAKLSKPQRKDLEDLIFWYLTEPQNNFTNIFLLIDSRHPPTPQDLDIITFLQQQHQNFIIVLTKIDKLKQNQQTHLQQNISRQFPGHQIIPFSAITNQGKKDINRLLFQ